MFLPTDFFLLTGKSQALIHKKTEYFLDIELKKKDFFINCSGGPKDDNSILSINLIDSDTYYNFYYRRVITLKQCYEHKKMYMDMLKGVQFLRIVASHPTERRILDSEKKAVLNSFKKAIKIIYGPFIRLQAGDKCKAYFSEQCDLPKNYWGWNHPRELISFHSNYYLCKKKPRARNRGFKNSHIFMVPSEGFLEEKF